MADNSIREMKISVEGIVHSLLRKTIQTISDDYGIRIDAICVDWIDVSTPGRYKALMANLELKTTTTQ